MASLGHVAIGMAAARLYSSPPLAGRTWLKAAALWSALSMLPDADVIGFALGVEYGDEWGHRGATHSLLFSVGLGSVLGLAAPLAGLPRLRTALTASAVLASSANRRNGAGCTAGVPAAACIALEPSVSRTPASPTSSGRGFAIDQYRLTHDAALCQAWCSTPPPRGLRVDERAANLEEELALANDGASRRPPAAASQPVRKGSTPDLISCREARPRVCP